MNRDILLGDVLLDIQAGKSFQTEEVQARPDELGVLKVSAVTWSAFRPEEAKAVLETYNPLESHRIKSGDLLISRANTKEFVGAVVLVDRDYPFRLLSDKTLRLVVDERKVNKEYLLFSLRASKTRDHIEHLATGSSDSMRNISQSVITSIPLSLPHLSIQQRIATHLTAQFASAKDACRAAQIQLKEIENLANAIISQSVELPDTGFAILGDVLDEVKQGVGKTWADYPVLGATRGGLALAREPVGKSPERYKPVMCGTVFYNPMRIMIGSIAMVDDDDTPGITSPDYVALRGKPGLVDSRWFYYWLRSPYGVSCIASLARGAVRERMLFNRLAEGTIELPPYNVQVAAAKALAELKPMRLAIERQLAEINSLPAKILAKAFDFSE